MLLSSIRTTGLLENPGYTEYFEVLKYHSQQQQQKKCIKQSMQFHLNAELNESSADSA